MSQFANFIITTIVLTSINCKPYDDGKYSYEKYRIYDDGKYYRPVDEGKYIPGDEGKYTYIYTNRLYPAFPYIHMLGPSGGNGGEGGFGPDGRDGQDDVDVSNRIEYIGHKIYADRFPYVHKVIEALVDKYVSTDTLFGEESDGSSNHYNKIFADKEVAAKCQYLERKNSRPFQTTEYSPPQPTESSPLQTMDEKEFTKEFVTQYPPRFDAKDGENVGSYYSFKGTKVLNNVDNGPKVKVEFEVFVRVVEDVTE